MGSEPDRSLYIHHMEHLISEVIRRYHSETCDDRFNLAIDRLCDSARRLRITPLGVRLSEGEDPIGETELRSLVRDYSYVHYLKRASEHWRNVGGGVAQEHLNWDGIKDGLN